MILNANFVMIRLFCIITSVNLSVQVLKDQNKIYTFLITWVIGNAIIVLKTASNAKTILNVKLVMEIVFCIINFVMNSVLVWIHKIKICICLIT